MSSNVTVKQGSQIRQIWRILRQNCSDDSTEVTEGVTSGLEIATDTVANATNILVAKVATRFLYILDLN